MATPTSLPATFVAGNVLTAAQMNNLRGAFRVLQVVSTTKTDTYSMSSTTFADVTGLSATITPSSVDSKIMVIASVSGNQNAGTSAFVRLRRGSTDIAIGDTAGNRIRVTSGFAVPSTSYVCPTFILATLDSPATTSATTYVVRMAAQNNGVACYVNRTDSDTDSAVFARNASSITVMEISA